MRIPEITTAMATAAWVDLVVDPPFIITRETDEHCFWQLWSPAVSPALSCIVELAPQTPSSSQQSASLWSPLACCSTENSRETKKADRCPEKSRAIVSSRELTRRPRRAFT